MKPLSLLSLTIFACGFLCAWFVKPVKKISVPEEIAAVKKSPRPRVTALQRETSDKKRAEARIARILDGNETWRPETASDYRGLATALQRRAGFGGLDDKAERLLKGIVASWYDSEPDAALNWALSLGNPSDEAAMMNVIVERCAENDWRAAVALAEEHGAVAGRKLDMPLLIVKAMQTLNPEEFVRIDRMFTGRSVGDDSRIKLTGDFPFAETLNLYGADRKPQAVLEEWARRDFGAVWEWASPRNEPQFRDDFSLSVLSSIWAGGAEDDQIAGFAAYLVGEACPVEIPDRNLEIAWDLLTERPSSGLLRSVVAQAPEGDRQDTFNNLLRIGASNMKFGTENKLIRNELLGQMTSAELLAAFESNRNTRSWSPDLYKEPLIRLGYSPEEIERMLPE